jgi:hypothetical protein
LKVLLTLPPFTQLNTSYPSISYLKGFLNTLSIDSHQLDLSLEVILKIFSSKGLTDIFDLIERNECELTENGFRVFTQRKRYIHTIDAVISFLQNKNPTIAHLVCQGGYLPEASRFRHNEDISWAFGTMGIHDKARHLCTLYLEDIGDLIAESVDPFFGFSRYAERLARTATQFDELHHALQQPNTPVSETMLSILHENLEIIRPDLVCLSVPFPGNVFAAFKCGQYIKKQYPHITVALGGGYVNTELRRVYDERVFTYFNFITLDDGEAPLKHLIEYLLGKRSKEHLKRTFCLAGETVKYINGSTEFDIPQREVGTPDYTDLKLDQYLSVIEIVNPMHRLWSDGRWNKLTLAHGCYWAKCTFCDVSLDYIKRYEPISPQLLCDRIETIMSKTGQNGFHFVDEAAPPALMRDLALEILARNLTVAWWTNIRFEKSFSLDLCRLLKASGCIAISGGLEVASDRLLAKMKKGVTIEQVSQVAHNFTSTGIKVHAYLMYGFPTQTMQETIDSVEIVRQMFAENIIQSGFWHQFAMTAHSPVGLSPSQFDVKSIGPIFRGFAENDLFHEDSKGADHEMFSDGLKNSIYHFMQGEGMDLPLSFWFDFPIPETKVEPQYIPKLLAKKQETDFRPNDLVIWLGGDAIEMIILKPRKNKKMMPSMPLAEIIFSGINEDFSITFDKQIAEWLIEILPLCAPVHKFTFAQMQDMYQAAGCSPIEEFIHSESFKTLRNRGLLFL